jgi:NAD(P)H dehydrogenase (quinone)
MNTRYQILIVYEDDHPVEVLAEAIAAGARLVPGAEVILKSPGQTSKADLAAAHALILGTPNWTGIKGSLKVWLDTTGEMWEEHILTGKVGATFTTSWGRHSGTEFTLLNVLHWFLGNGMLIVGLPWTERMRRSGSYYGATAIGDVTEDDLQQARDLGARVAEVTARLFGG